MDEGALMPDYLALKAEIAKPAYAAMTDAQIVAALLSGTVTTEAPESGEAIGRVWARRGVLGAARERAGNAGLTVAQRQTAWDAISMVEHDGFSGLDPANPAQRNALVAFLDKLIADSIMTQSDKTATLALLARTQTVARSIGWGILHDMDAASARAAIAAAREA
jgi:hypothetical protein